jgi:hypothetical protein
LDLLILFEQRDYDIESYALFRKERAMVEMAKETSLAPQVAMSERERLVNPGLSDEQIASIKDGTTIIYVFGEVVYDDIWRHRHMTMYCAVVDPSTWQVVHYRQYNRME